jgi:cullin 3
MDEKSVESIFTSLKNGVRDILIKRICTGLFEDLYRNAHTLVLHGHGERLYIGLKEIVTEYLETKVHEDILRSVDNSFLQTLNQVWNDHKKAMAMVRDILMYLDRTYVKDNELHNVYDLGLIVFRDQVVRHGGIQERFRAILFNMITSERNGELIDQNVIKNACQMLMELGINSRSVYEDDFERPFLEHSLDFYKMEFQKFLMKKNVSVYIIQVERRITEETERAKDYLDEATGSRILKIVELLIKKHLKTIAEMETGVAYMLENTKIEDLVRMYKLFSRVQDGVKTISDCVSKYLREYGKDKEKSTNPIEIVQHLLDLKDCVDSVQKNSFNFDPNFKNVIPMDYEYALNSNPKLPEYLSLYIEDKLKKRGNEVSLLDFS